MQHTQIINRDREAVKRAISSLVGHGETYCYLDFPDHSNVGDSAIWAGASKLLREVTGQDPSYVSSVENFSVTDLRRFAPRGPIFLHGGGNFGDIYPRHQTFREGVLKEFGERRVIQLPQSIKYRGEEGIARTADAIAHHNDFHMFVRDEPSKKFFEGHFGHHATLVPDTAFGLGPLPRPVASTGPILMLLRTDVERVAHDLSPFAIYGDAPRVDWLDEPRGFRRAIKLRAALVALATGRWSRATSRVLFFNMLANARVERGLKLLALGDRVVTDRLHAHILSTLMNIEHVAMDNDYGKIHGYIDAWTSDYQGVVKASNPQQVVAKLSALRDRVA